MTPDFKTVIEKTELNTVNPDDVLVHKTSVSLDEEKVYLTVEYKIFKGYKTDNKGEFIMKTEFGKPDSKIPKYGIFSVDKTFNNNYFGLEQLETEAKNFDSEKKVKDYFNL